METDRDTLERDKRHAAYVEKQRISHALLRRANAAHELRNYHDRDRYQDAAWLVNNIGEHE